jgi:hypothetical protein
MIGSTQTPLRKMKQCSPARLPANPDHCFIFLKRYLLRILKQ